MNKALLQELTDKYITGTATAAEERELHNLLADPAYLQAFEEMLLGSLEQEKYGQEGQEEVFRRIYARIEAAIRPPAPVRRLKPYLAAAAAVLLLVLAGGFYFLLQQPPSPPQTAQMEEVMSGSNKAVLTLADGSTVTVDSTARQIAQQGSGAIRQQNGQLQYTGATAAAGAYNTLTTPAGGQYRLRLPDGTEVWLNAASSIRFPISFDKHERKVELTGEAYFEVAQQASAPFKVMVNRQAEVLVLGTTFNINAYTDERNIKTTLLRGKVKVTAGSRDIQLSPGQQAVSTTTSLTINNAADTEKAIAWKNGLFNFQDASLEEVMRQLSRWYNITVVYENGIPDMEFYGKMQRNIPLSTMLKMLERTEVKFRLEGNNRLVVLAVK
ncbi:FecR domain-containing protein [Chitinophaga sp.]|uniref:FecR family protein n=1 Tax=Chitinophaga sp. TaxID=1869181 RepID=UPI0031D0CA83